MINNTYKDCDILNVYQKIVGNVGRMNHFLLEIRYTDKENKTKYMNMKIDKSDMYQELVELVEGKRQRIYASHNMTDIDIYKQGKDYCIEWSPSDLSYHCFCFKEKDFINHFVNSIKVAQEDKDLSENIER